MLRNFLYLDEDQLSQYVSQVEDGLRRVASRSKSSSSSTSGGASVKLAKLDGQKQTSSSESEEYADNGPARFERLLSLVEGDEDEFSWIEVTSADDVARARVGSVLSFAGELYQSELSRVASPGGLLDAIPLMRVISQMTPGTSVEFPGGADLNAMQQFGEAMNGSVIVQGDIDETDWRFVAEVPRAGGLDGFAYVVGKVAKVWGAGSWKPLPGLPIISQMPRDQKREFERKGPTEEGKMMWMEGPAVQLDLLAVYR